MFYYVLLACVGEKLMVLKKETSAGQFGNTRIGGRWLYGEVCKQLIWQTLDLLNLYQHLTARSPIETC